MMITSSHLKCAASVVEEAQVQVVAMKVVMRKKSLALVNVNQRTLHAGKNATNALTQSSEKKNEKSVHELA